MAKQPYIPLYIGDWEKDTNTISLEAEGALLKLIFKLWNADEKGLLSISFSQLAILLKKSEEMTVKILSELKENNILNIEFLPEKKAKIESRRMLKDVAISKIRSEVGKKGGRPEKQTKSKTKAKVKQNTEYDIDNDIECVIEYLNNTIGSNFQKKSKKNTEPIRARFRDNFKPEDFEKVILHKFSQWGQDPKMKEYLRPETLFGNKFEGYLQVANSPPPANSIQKKITSSQIVKNLYQDEPTNNTGT
jgi:uncharacterized phage protein (TIGR02220 family)